MGVLEAALLSQKKILAVSVIVVLVVFSWVIVFQNDLTGDSGETEFDLGKPADNPADTSLPRAVLIDALYSSHPNDVFSESLENVLREAGFEVDVYRGDVVTVDFLKRLQGGYKLVIFRMHSALSKWGDLYLFTDEDYSTQLYRQEQDARPALVKEAYATDSAERGVFAVNWGFVKMRMSGKFDGSLVIVMGCDGAGDSLLFREFVNQGAVGCVGWSGPVLLSHSDKAVLCLVEFLYLQGLPLGKAVSSTNEFMKKDPLWESVLKLYVP